MWPEELVQAPAAMPETELLSTLRTVGFEFAAYEVSHIHYSYDSISWSNILAKEIVIKKCEVFPPKLNVKLSLYCVYTFLWHLPYLFLTSISPPRLRAS